MFRFFALPMSFAQFKVPRCAANVQNSRLLCEPWNSCQESRIRVGCIFSLRTTSGVEHIGDFHLEQLLQHDQITFHDHILSQVQNREQVRRLRDRMVQALMSLGPLRSDSYLHDPEVLPVTLG